MSDTPTTGTAHRGEPGATRAPREVFREALRNAVLGPPGRDALPWVFRLHDGDTLELRADRSRASTVADPYGREAIIGCGAALFHVSAALHAAGYGAAVELLPVARDPDLLARLRLDAPHVPSPADRALVAAIVPGRLGDLQREDRGIAPHVLSLLLCAARVEGAWLGFVDLPSLRRELAELVVAAHRRQGDDPRHPHERAARAHRSDGATTDVLPGYTAGLPELLSYLGPARPRRANRDLTLAARARAWVERAPTIAVLLTPGDTRRDWLVAGRALARVLLTARAAGISASYLNQPVEVAELRPRVAALVREAADPGVPGRRGGMPVDATPQIVLRLGYAARVPSGSHAPSVA
jgi:hypothetical protein